MRKYAIALFAALALSACDDFSSYRYPCQDPVNFNSKECTPPVCEADGSCTKYLLDIKLKGE